MAGLTRMASEPDSLIAAVRAGASASVTAMATTLGITRGGDRWATTVAAGIHTTVGARGAAPRLRMSTVFGATPLTRAPAQLGPIRTPGIMGPLLVELTTTRKPAGARWAAAVTTPTFTPATPTVIAAAQLTIRTRALSRVAAPATLATSTAVRAQRIAVVSRTTPTRTLVLPPGRTTSTQERTAPSTATIAIPAIGPVIVATAGKTSTGPNPNCRVNSERAPKVYNVPRTSDPHVQVAAPAWAVAVGVRPAD